MSKRIQLTFFILFLCIPFVLGSTSFNIPSCNVLNGSGVSIDSNCDGIVNNALNSNYSMYTNVANLQSLNDTLLILSINNSKVDKTAIVRTTGPLFINGLSNANINNGFNLSITQVNSVTGGFLSAYDFIRFNNSVNSTFSSNGSINYIPVFTSTNSIANSNMTWDGENFTINGNFKFDTKGAHLLIGNQSVANDYNLKIVNHDAGVYVQRQDTNEAFLLLFNGDIAKGGQIRGLTSGSGVKITSSNSLSTYATIDSTAVTSGTKFISNDGIYESPTNYLKLTSGSYYGYGKDNDGTYIHEFAGNVQSDTSFTSGVVGSGATSTLYGDSLIFEPNAKIQSTSGFIGYGGDSNIAYPHEFFGGVYSDTGFYGSGAGLTNIDYNSLSNLPDLSDYPKKTLNNTWTGLNLWYGDTWFYGGVNIVNQTIKQYVLGNNSGGIELKNIANQTIGSWIDANGSATFYTNGRVGIGTNNPQHSLHVESGNGYFRNQASNEAVYVVAKNDSHSFLYFGDTDSGTIGRLDYDHSGDYLATYVNATERMRINGRGFVGIGTSTPTAPLYVQGNYSSGVDGTFIVQNLNNGASAYGGFVIAGDQYSKNTFFYSASSGATGTFFGMPKASLQAMYANNAHLALGTADAYNMSIFTNGTSRIYLTNNGKVGIGTSTPSEKLDVNGTIKTNLTGVGNAYLCVDANGLIYRSSSICV